MFILLVAVNRMILRMYPLSGAEAMTSPLANEPRKSAPAIEEIARDGDDSDQAERERTHENG
jgi:hypothetical protein